MVRAGNATHRKTKATNAQRSYGMRKTALDAYIGVARTPDAVRRLTAWLDSTSTAGMPLRQPTRLQDHDVLTLGKTELRISIQFVGDTQQEPPPRAAAPIELDEQELKLVVALAAPFRVPGALAARPPSRSAISTETQIPERTVTRRLDDLAAKLRLPPHEPRDRSFVLAQRILEWGLDGQRSTSLEFTPPDD